MSLSKSILQNWRQRRIRIAESRDRILFVAWVNGSYVLLHQFMKKTQKTPAREIEKAKRELADIVERGIDYEQEE